MSLYLNLRPEMSHDPNTYIRDIVIPVFQGQWTENSFEYESSIGTAFLIGNRGFAITAAHVIDQIGSDIGKAAVGFIGDDNQWIPIRIIDTEIHDLEDVGIIKLEKCPIASWLVSSDKHENQSCTYDSWGYPIAIAELSKKYEEHQLESPDLIYTHGYVRRRISKQLPVSIFRGSAFYELSEVAGEGCSGSPVIARTSIGKPFWEVFGIYIGTANAGFEASYAVRSDAIFNWHPKIINRTLREESSDGNV